ncbi:MAG: Eco29kI family restriction endonuclease [Acidobacteria bacterium]|nr:Eco29kI family restriction endonuclease [Acidobacteriota bacterium]MYK79668.1 Eco29kI family restriction endonuclease [Acidobacteriota bacterium]
MERKYDPLSVEELGRNAARAITNWPAVALPPDKPFEGSGVYAVYYAGVFPAYVKVTGEVPIYVGQAVLTKTKPRPLFERLREHARSIDDARNLDLADFRCRWLVLDTVWINLTEQLLISEHRPLWNWVVAGFGNHNQGRTRNTQERSWWDTLHPGRKWALNQRTNVASVGDITAAIHDHLRGQHSM